LRRKTNPRKSAAFISENQREKEGEKVCPQICADLKPQIRAEKNPISVNQRKLSAKISGKKGEKICPQMYADLKP